jgi:hypothetical protein
MRVRLFDSITNPFAANPHRANSNQPRANLKGPEWILEECPIPTGRLQRPGTDEDAAVNDDRPHADESMTRTVSRANAENLALVDGMHDRTREAARRHEE